MFYFCINDLKISMMKKIILFLFALTMAFTACEPDDMPDKGKLDPNATIILKPAKGVQVRSIETGLTALEVVQNAVNIKWQSHYFDNVYYDDAKDIARTFIEEHRDLVTPALKMWGTDIINQDGEYYRDFINGFNVVITDTNNDTIAQVPDAVINSARPLIEAAYNDSNFTEVYRLFNEAFTFVPY